MTIDFSRAPIIRNNPTKGVFVEGVLANAEEAAIFEYAVSTYSFLVPRNTTMTGSQWIAAIKKQYDVAEPRNQAVVDTIERVMLVKRFSDDHVLFDDRGNPQFRGTGNQCFEQTHKLQSSSVLNSGWGSRPIDQVSPADVSKAELATAGRWLGSMNAGIRNIPGEAERTQLIDSGVAFAVSFFELPPEHLVVVNSGASVDARSTLVARMHHLLKAAPVGVQTFTEKEAIDRQANLTLMLNLTRHLGYGQIVSSGEWNDGPRPGREKTRVDLDTTHKIEDSMLDFFDALSDGDWDDSRPVFLCRPAPIINPFASIRPFESLVHSQLIGWRLPQPMVELYSLIAREVREQKAQARQHGERAV